MVTYGEVVIACASSLQAVIPFPARRGTHVSAGKEIRRVEGTDV
jgi:hypothetical protein